MAGGRSIGIQVWPGADIQQWHVYDGPVHCTAGNMAGSALVAMATAAAGTPLY